MNYSIVLVARALALCLPLLAAPVVFAASVAPAATPELPAAPAFDGWVVKSDTVVSAEKTAGIAKKLGGKISALRNVIYDVGGKKVQVNVLVASDAAEGDKLVASLSKEKASWSVARKGNVVYELVGKNDVLDEMKKAHDTLAGT